jgi:hypothetical protein
MKAAICAVVLMCVYAMPLRAQTCAPYTHPIHVDFETQTPKPVYDNSLNVTGIRNLFQTRGMPVGGPHIQALGVTYVTPAFGLEVRTRATKAKKGVCIYLEEARATFSLRDMHVYIASEYPMGSCEYNAIKDHENQHVSINVSAFKEYAPYVRAELERLLAVEQPVFAREGQSVTKAKVQDLSRRMNSILDAFQTAMSQRNAIIDTPQNYKAISDICRDWDRGNVWPKVAPPAKVQSKAAN